MRIHARINLSPGLYEISTPSLHRRSSYNSALAKFQCFTRPYCPHDNLPHVALGRKGLAESDPMSTTITLVDCSVTRLFSLFMIQTKGLGLETEDAWEQGALVGSAFGDFVPRLGLMFAPPQHPLGYSMFHAISAYTPHSWLQCNLRKRKSRRACMTIDGERASPSLLGVMLVT